MTNTPFDIDQLKAANPIDQLMETHGVKLSAAHGQYRHGSCLCAPSGNKGKRPLWCSPATGAWGCFKSDQCDGDQVDFLMKMKGLSFIQAAKALGGAEMAGQSPEALNRLRAERARQRELQETLNARHAASERKKAHRIWQAGEPIRGTLAAEYLQCRGLMVPDTPALRYSASEIFYVPPNTARGRPRKIHEGPALLAAIQGPDGTFIGLHRTWLDPATETGKAEIADRDGTLYPAKKMRGLKKGGAIRVWPGRPGETIGLLLIGEGIETTLSAAQAFERCKPDRWRAMNGAAWAACDLGNMINQPVAPAMTVVLLADNDGAGSHTMSMVMKARDHLRSQAWNVVIAMPPTAGDDFNDLLRRAA